MGDDYPDRPPAGGGHAAMKKAPARRPGPASLIAVNTLRHLLREEKQGKTAFRLSSADKSSIS